MACGCGTCAACAVGTGAAAPAPTPPGACGPRLAQRLAPTVDRLRARLVKAGLRVYDVWLVWTVWSGEERGEGTERELRRVPILPQPRVQDLTSLSLSPYGAGILPVGSVRVDQITARLTADNLTGLAVPERPYYAACGVNYPGALPVPAEALALSVGGTIGRAPPRVGDRVTQPISFFYEVVENDSAFPQRQKFRLFSRPFKRPGNFDFTIVLERISEDRERTGLSRFAPDEG